MRRGFWLAVLAAFGLGLFLGYAFRAWRHPTLQEQADEVARDLRRRLDGLR
jgi:hypothetical protein